MIFVVEPEFPGDHWVRRMWGTGREEPLWRERLLISAHLSFRNPFTIFSFLLLSSPFFSLYGVPCCWRSHGKARKV